MIQIIKFKCLKKYVIIDKNRVTFHLMMECALFFRLEVHYV